MKHNQGKGKALDVSGIPLPNTIVQVDGQTVETNREEPSVSFKSETRENVGHTYFSDEEERLGNIEEPFVNNKADQKWSEGLADESNLDEDDNDDDECLLPETQPLHVDPLSANGEDDDAELVLRPDNVEDDSGV